MSDKERLEEIKENWNNVDWGIDKSDINWLVEQAELVKELEQKVRVDSELFDKQVQQNKRYRNLLESLSNTHDIASEIMKKHPDKKIIDANDLLQYILRKINDELEEAE